MKKKKSDIEAEIRNLLIEAEIINSNMMLRNVDSDKFERLRAGLNDIVDVDGQEQEGAFEGLEAVINAAPCTISWVNKDLSYIGVNRVLAEVCGVKQDEFPGKRIGFFTEERLFEDFVIALFKSEKDRIEKELSAHIDGVERWFYIVGRKYQKGSNAVLIGIDITEQKIAQQNMIMNDKLALLGEVAASIVHEIKNPLAIISLYAENVGMQAKKGQLTVEKAEQAVSKITRESKRINRIVTNLSNFSRNSGKDAFEPVDIDRVVQDTVELWTDRWGKSGIELSTQLDDHFVVMGNDIEISQVLLNLLVNASHAIEKTEERWIKVHVYQKDQMIQICVRDSGPGIPEDLQEKLFKPFFTTKKKGAGTGLGLAVSIKIAEKHNGELRINKDCSNTEFQICLPIPQVKAA